MLNWRSVSYETALVGILGSIPPYQARQTQHWHSIRGTQTYLASQFRSGIVLFMVDSLKEMYRLSQLDELTANQALLLLFHLELLPSEDCEILRELHLAKPQVSLALG